MIDDSFNQQCLKAHNNLRDLHGNPALTYNKELAVSAQKWADHLAREGITEHSPDSDEGVGENVAMKFMSGGTVFTGKEATEEWYSEIEDYDFEAENQLGCGHFSQVIWKATQEAGFGRAHCKDGQVFVVGQYLPPGNFMNKWRENVPPPKHDRRGSSSSSGSSHDLHEGPIPAHKPAASALVKDLQPQTKGPRDPHDRFVGRNVKTRIENGTKIIVVTETYETPLGAKYEVTQETIDDPYKKTDQLPGHHIPPPPPPPSGPIWTSGRRSSHSSQDSDHDDRHKAAVHLDDIKLLAQHDSHDSFPHHDPHAHKLVHPHEYAGAHLNVHPGHVDLHGGKDVKPGQRELHVFKDSHPSHFDAHGAFGAPKGHSPHAVDMLGFNDDDDHEDFEFHAKQDVKVKKAPGAKDTHDNHAAPKKVELEQFRHQLVDAQNQYRQKHSARDLKRDEGLDQLAQKWADHLRDKRLFLTCDWKYKNEAVGEATLVKLYNGDQTTGQEVARQWYEEGSDFPYGQEDPKTKLKKCAHFSQMLWAGSQQVGVGRAFDKEGHCWMVSLYQPAGNKRGRFHENVSRH